MAIPKNIGLAGVTLILIIGAVCLVKLKKRSQVPGGIRIGILQFVSHPALDQAKQGFIECMEKQFGNKVSFELQNAEGSMLMAQSIAQRLHNDSSVSMVYAIATPAAQAMQAIEAHKPIIIAAVTDPAAANLLSGNNVCGSSDLVDGAAIVDIALQICPHAKRIGILSNPSEPNSALCAEQMRKALASRSKEALSVGLAGETDVALAVKVACHKADVLIAPTDNLVATSMQSIAHITQENKIPLIVSFNEAVKQGALAGCGIDYYQSGKDAAQCAIQIIEHNAQPSSLGVKRPTCDQITVNRKALTLLGLNLPENLASKAIFID